MHSTFWLAKTFFQLDDILQTINQSPTGGKGKKNLNKKEYCIKDYDRMRQRREGGGKRGIVEKCNLSGMMRDHGMGEYIIVCS